MSRINIKEATLEQLEEQCVDVLGTQYGHNIIALICQEVEDRFGEKEADRLFDLYQG